MNFYEYLEIDQTASSQEIHKAFRKLAKSKHPDYNEADTAFWDMVELNIIRDTLLNPAKRAEYDRSLTAGISHPQTTEAAPSPTVFHKVKQFFTYHCKVCGHEMSSTWQGFCLYHYLEYTNQLHNENFIFEYGGQRYKWVDPPPEIHNKTRETPSTQAPIILNKSHIILYIGLILTIVLMIIIALRKFL